MNMSETDKALGDTDVQAEMARGISAAQAGDKLGAHTIFKALAARNAQMPDIWVWLGGTSSNLREAEAAFQRAVMLDPGNEEANLGLRWVALRRQVTEQAGASDLSTGAFDKASTAGLLSGSLTSSSLGTGNLASGALSTAPISAAEVDKDMKMKVGKASGRRLNVPVAAIFLFALSIVLYAIVAWFLIFQR